MKKIIGCLDNYEGGRKKAVCLVGLIMLLQFLDYATTKIVIMLSGGNAIEFNPVARGLFNSSGWGIECFLAIKLIFVCWFSLYLLSRKKSHPFLFDFWFIGVLIFGFLFIVLSNIINLLIICFFISSGLWTQQAVTSDLVYNLDAIVQYLPIALVFAAIGTYVWRKYQRVFCFGPVFICVWIMAFAVINLF